MGKSSSITDFLIRKASTRSEIVARPQLGLFMPETVARPQLGLLGWAIPSASLPDSVERPLVPPAPHSPPSCASCSWPAQRG